MDRKIDRKKRIQFFSEKTGNFYQLLPTSTVSVLRINGVPMQRFVNIDPLTDAQLKIASAKPKGKVLDMCTGLGYTAIQCAKLDEVKEIVTIEKDSEVLEIARLNDASKELFNNQKIKIIINDATQVIRDFGSESFDCIIHDPPTFRMAPELYHVDFYKEIFRVLKGNGRLWHYAPEPGKAKSIEKSARFVKGIIKRLREAGFHSLIYDKKSCGIIGIR